MRGKQLPSRMKVHRESGVSAQGTTKRFPDSPVLTPGASYTEEHARAGINAHLPEIETWLNQFPRYEIEIQIPEFTSVCPKTGLPDFGKLALHYMPDKKCLELKSLKMYALAYRNLGIFYENVVNRFLRDVVEAAEPVWATLSGEFTPRGGLQSRIVANWSREHGFGLKRAAGEHHSKTDP